MTKVVPTYISACEGDLAIRIPTVLAEAAGFTEASQLFLSAAPGRLTIILRSQLALEEKLAAFDPKQYGGEVMPGPPAGAEFPHRP